MTRTKQVAVLGLLAALAVASPVWAGNPGEVGVLSLRMGVGAREAGMGGAGVAASEGAAALFWNPANNAFLNSRTDLVVQHHRYLGLFNHESAGVAHRVGGGVVGLLFSGFYADELQRRGEEHVGISEGTFRPYDVAFGISYARAVAKDLAVGAVAKVVHERIDLYSDTAIAFDLFLTHRTLIEGLAFGASLTNLGPKMNLRTEPFDLPAAARIGAAWTPAEGVFAGKATMAADLVFPNDTAERAHLGFEYRLIDEFALRVGTRIKYENQGVTAGAGFRSGRLGVDYAFEQSKVDGFDDGHKFSLNMSW